MSTSNAVVSADIQPTRGSIEYWAQQKPNTTAIIDGNRQLTYKQWNTYADALAEGLVRQGIGPDDIIVTRLQIRYEWAIFASAAAKIGCTILGLNWRLTPSEVNYVLMNSGATVVVCDDESPTALIPAFDGLPIKLRISMDVPAEGFVSYDQLLAADAPALYSAGDARLIIYTSGTTGLPKGVRNDVAPNFTAQQATEYYASIGQSRKLNPGDVMLLTLPLHHAAGPANVGAALSNGNLLIMLRRFDAEETLRLIERHKVSYWTCVPTMFKRLKVLPEETLAKYDISSLNNLAIGAAPVPPSLKSWIREYFGEVLFESYGATEVGMISDLSPEMQKIKPDSSGKPHRHVSIEIRDDDGRVLPANTPGEIWVRTPVTIRNYINAPTLGTDTVDKDGFFRIGDAGHMDEDGFLFITDRTKDMIISGGVNLYPAEIEAAIIQHDDVQDAAVIGIPDEEFGEKVLAFVELREGRNVSVEDLMSFTAGKLASYKCPKSIELCDSLPRNTMGKLLKRELREPYWRNHTRRV